MIKQYVKGILVLLAASVLIAIAGVVYFIYKQTEATIVLVIVLMGITTLPYFLGKKSEPEKKGNYKLKK